MTPRDLSKARRHLLTCPVLGPHVQRLGPCTLVPRPDEPFTMLVRCVIGQQISPRAAETIYQRFTQLMPELSPEAFENVAEDAVRSVGISGPKQRALRAITAHVKANPGFLDSLPTLDDAAFRTAVTAIKGIGPWSADMMLMFGYGRLDVLPVGDYGVQAGVRDLFDLDHLPKPQELMRRAEPWRPYRSIASWYLGRLRDQPAKA